MTKHYTALVYLRPRIHYFPIQIYPNAFSTRQLKSQHQDNQQTRTNMSARHIHNHRPIKHSKQSWQEKSTNVVPLYVQSALRSAIELEGVSSADFNDLLWIMAQESAGIVGTRNGASTARGLYQLLRAQYGLNPHGEQSFGNAVEECQGGIRYIYGRYHSAKSAQDFWKRHHWY
ncbi:hypothetical protein [Paraburkholderia diazotrophica]|uniref:aggregation-promoting factor C-terminal-like domain-containing protein n=1 Tax=Paraburkholderia diazotrophica TaxID=667676 RepID=UPI00316C311B